MKKDNDNIVYKVVKRTIIWSIPIAIFMILLLKEPKEGVLGYIFGLIIAILNFLLLNDSIKKSVRMAPDKAERYAAGQYGIRMLINGVVLIIGAKADYLNFLTLCVGLLIVKFVIKISAILDKGFFK